MILSGDVGGTKTNLAYFTFEENTLILNRVESYVSNQYRSLDEVIRHMLAEYPGKISAAAFGIAGPVIQGKSRLTNLDWEVDARGLAALLRLPSVGLLNDLEATAYGTLHLSEKDTVPLNHGTPKQQAPIAVIAAGTGLGEGGLFWDGARYRALPSEGGHTDFAPRTELEIELLRYMLQKHPHVSYERVVAGPGLYEMYRFFRSRTEHDEPEWLRDQIASGNPSAVVSQAALERKDEVCEQALDMFVSLYGAEAGNLALKLLSTGGVYIGGGIAPKIVVKLQEGSFMKAFTAKGRHAELLRNVPVHVILNDQTALLGAAHYAMMMQ